MNTRIRLITALILLALATIAPAATPPRPAARPAGPSANATILPAALQGALADTREIVFAARNVGTDPHWYANFSYWSEDASRMLYAEGGARLCKLDLGTQKLTALIDDPAGGVRDPVVHYDGRKILFSYRKGASKHYNLYEINIDGSGLRQITSGPWDDIEPAYLPNGDIVFCSSRCKRWVNCWFTQVAILHRCDGDGNHLRPISSNTEHDNTPAVLPDGRVLYTRWEYVDRSQVEFHHLWVANPDGTGQMTYFGNMQPGIVMIDSKAIPGTDKIVSIFSPGHGVNEHRGTLTVVSPLAGPDAAIGSKPVKGCPPMVRDPYPLSESVFLVARKNELLLVDSTRGQYQVIHTDRQEVHEPSPIRARQRERIIPDRTKLEQQTGQLILADINIGRNMQGVEPGEIKKLLVLESLPKPVNFSGGPEPLTWLGTFTLERVLGTVPVEEDGSAYIELPANRQVFFVALDKNDLSVKRMQSWVSVMPGETTGCVGCHEQRSQVAPVSSRLAALKRAPSPVEPFAGLPDVIDFTRHIQPILDQHCVSCHSYDKPDGGIILSGDHGPLYSHSYWMLIASNQVADGRNGYGNRPPRSIGSSASRLMKKIDGSHYDVKLTAKQWRLVWMWIESGATYAGTYASLGCGMVGVPMFENLKEPSVPKPRAMEIIERRCYGCHAPLAPNQQVKGKVALPALPAPRTPGSAAYERILVENDPLIRRSTHVLYNLSRPEKSILLLGPLAKEAGGFGSCRAIGGDGKLGAPASVFANTQDADYRQLLQIISRSSQHLNQIKRFDMPGFRPNEHYVREMKRYGILPARFDRLKDTIDVYETDQAYWRSLWWGESGLSKAGR